LIVTCYYEFMNSAFILVITFVTLLLSPSPVNAGDKRIPFSPGEKLFFQVRWAFIPAAEGVLEILPMETVEGVKCYHFTMTARTYKFVDVFFKVRDKMEAFADGGMTHSLLFKNVQDGKKKRNITLSFDWEKLQAHYSNFDERRDPISIPPGTFDPLSVFYAFRLIDLKEGEEIKVPVTDGRKCIVGRAKVIKREKIKVRDTLLDTFLVEPDLGQVGGVFEKSKNAKLQIWVTADGDSIPVRVESEVAVGSFVAELVSRTRPTS
jgi:predicted DNA-binding antitoxin AbrB/MazE fold protein